MAEELALQSMDEVRAYIKMELRKQSALGQKKIEAWLLAKRSTWLFLLGVAYLQYYLIDIESKTLALPTLIVSVPLSNNSLHKRI